MIRKSGGPPSRGPFFVVLSILALALAGVLVFQYSSLVDDFEVRRIEELHLRTEALAVSKEALITTRLSEIDRRVEVEVEDLVARAYGGGPVHDEILERLQFRATDITEFMIVDGSGEIRAWTGNDDSPGTIGREVASEHREREHGGPILSQPFRETFDSIPSAAISRSLQDPDGTPEWVVVAVLDLDRLADAVDVTTAEGLRSISLIAQSGDVYFRRPEPENGPPPVIEDLAGRAEGAWELTSRLMVSQFDGQPKISAQLASNTWPVVIRVSEDLAPTLSQIDVYRRREAVRWSIIGGTFALLLLALTVSAGRHIRSAQMLSERETRLKDMALRDGLTGLATRMLVTDRLEQSIVQAGRTGTRVAVVYIDLDKFKPINDSLGHAAGDEVLRAVAQRMSTAVRQSDTLGRIGGDEFIAVLSNVTDSDAAEATAGKLIHFLEEPISVEQTQVRTGASAGVALYPDHGTTVTALIGAADRAMYKAKETATHVHLADPQPESQQDQHQDF